MTHDPLCPWAQDGGANHRGECFLIEGSEPPINACNLIAKVRSDEQQQVASRLTAYHAEGCIGGVSNLGCGCGLWNDVLTYSVELP